MELTEEFLICIASQIATLNIQAHLIQQVLVHLGVKPDAFDEVMEQALQGPIFQEARALVLADLRESLSPSA